MDPAHQTQAAFLRTKDFAYISHLHEIKSFTQLNLDCPDLKYNFDDDERDDQTNSPLLSTPGNRRKVKSRSFNRVTKGV